MALNKLILNWYDKNKRDLPWRHTKNPYNIWISEIILQQTRMEQGIYLDSIFLKNGVPAEVTSIKQYFQSVTATLEVLR